MDLIGKTLSGCEILELVGRGGMGEVYRARQISLDREVAIKVLSHRYSENEEFRNRFFREARSIAKVNHPNILQIYEVGEHDGIPFMVMEFIRGESLGERLTRTGFIPWEEATDFVIAAARGLASAARGLIIHRDIKPDNLMVTAEGALKVSDFGLAKECTSSELTQTDALMGTPAYMSPEQCDGLRDLDTRTDIYSLGGTFYRMVTGVLPFNAPTAVAMLYKHKNEPIIPPEEYMPNLPKALSAVIHKMMAKSRDDRYQGMDEVADALQQVLTNPDRPPDTEMTLKFEGLNDFDFNTEPAPRTTRRPVPGQAEQVVEFIARGEAYMKAGRPLAAFTCWQKALALDPGNADLRQRVDKAKSESTVASLKIAEDLLEEGSLEKRRHELHQVIKIDPDNVDAIEKLQALDIMESRKRQTISGIRQHLNASRYHEALELWNSLHPALRDKSLGGTMERVETNILPCLALVAEAESLTRTGHFEEAMAKWSEAAELDPQNDRVTMGQQETQRYINRVDNLLREAYEYEVKGLVDAAVGSYDEILRLVPHHEKASRKALRCLIEEAQARDNKGHLEGALEMWEKVVARAPDNPKAKARAEELRGLRSQLKALDDGANGALHRGQYTRAIHGYTQVLRLDPHNRAAATKLHRARRERLLRRFVPLIAIVFILLGIALAAPYVYRDLLIEEGENAYRARRYGEAIQTWRQVQAIPLWGQFVAAELEGRIREAQLTEAGLDLAERLETSRAAPQDDGLLATYREGAKAYRTGVEGSRVYDRDRQVALILNTYLDEADLLFLRREYEATSAHYDMLQEYAEAQGGALPIRHSQRADGLAEYLMGQRSEELGDRVRAVVHYAKAVEFLPDFAPARDRLNAAHAAADISLKLAKQARAALAAGTREDNFDLARKHWEKAAALARQLRERSPDSPAAAAILREVEWRLDAGPDMVLFLLPTGDAFAIDRYEYPNRKGETPKPYSFLESRALAAAAGKALPTPEEWRHAAQGAGERPRPFPWGDIYRPERARCSVDEPHYGPAPSGSHPRGRTPEGLYDLSGNLAEWVDTGETEDAPDAQAMGGHYGSTTPEDLASDAITVYENIRLNPGKVGFRAVKRYRGD